MDEQYAPTTSWQRVALAPIVAGTARRPIPGLWHRADGAGMLYPGKTHAFVGESESGKTWAALAACAEVVQDGGTVLYIDFEDDADTFVDRLRILAVEDSLITRRAAYVRPDERFAGDAVKDLGIAAETLPSPPALVVLDGVTEAMTLHGWNIDKANDVAAFLALLPRRFDRFGAAVVMIDHVVKSKDERGRFAIGSQHKMAGINGASFVFSITEPFAPGAHGQAAVLITKDRPGQVRKTAVDHKRAGVFHLRSTGDDSAIATLEAATAEFRPTVLMTRVSEFLERQDEPVPTKEVERSVSGKASGIRQALEALMDDGYVSRATADRGAKVWTSLRVFDSNEDGYLALIGDRS